MIPKVHSRARIRRRPNNLLYDDLVQEGMIAAWRACETGRARGDGYLINAASKRMDDILAGKPHLGAPARSARDAPVTISLNACLDDDPAWDVPAITPGPEDPDQVAYISATLALLSDTDRAVALGVMEGRALKQIDRDHNRAHGWARYRMARIANQLRDHLAFLIT